MGNQVSFPEFVYHGTSLEIAKSFVEPISVDALKQYSINKDFGSGLYTTIDVAQSEDWAKRCLEVVEEEFKSENLSQHERKAYFDQFVLGKDEFTPVVVRYRFESYFDLDFVENRIFMGESDDWAEFILRHRLHSRYQDCDCTKRFTKHPEIVVGLMADNKIREVMKDYEVKFGVNINKNSIRWFRKAISKTQDGHKLQGLGLGNQISFHDPILNGFIKLDGLMIANLWYNEGKGIEVKWNDKFKVWGEFK